MHNVQEFLILKILVIQGKIKKLYFIYLTTKKSFFLGLFSLNARVVLSRYQKKTFEKAKTQNVCCLNFVK